MTPTPHHIEHLLASVWSMNGTDLLLTAGAYPLIRVDGALRPLGGTSPMSAPELDRMINGVLGRDLSAQLPHRKQIDFAFTWADKARVRGNAFYQRGTHALSLRVIPFEIPSVEEIGLPTIVLDWCRLPRGFVLVTGPTGSGKSTSLAAMLDYINTNRAVHIITIEDPIEYVHFHKQAAVNQREVGDDTGSFADALRSALREDPDVVLVGEMRDPESIQAALTIAETGHLVFATLHTNDTAQTLDRIVDVFPATQQPQVRLQLTHTLVGILNQQLIPMIGGGRTAAFEVLVGTHAIRNLIREGKTRQIRNLVATGQRERMQTLEAALSELVAQGRVSYDEAVLWTLYPDEVKRPHPAPYVVANG
jgi:twitching motility protein PilT